MGRPRIYSNSEENIPIIKLHSKVEKNICNVANSLKEKYKHLLGSKEPVVLLQRCTLPKNVSVNHFLQTMPKNILKVKKKRTLATSKCDNDKIDSHLKCNETSKKKESTCSIDTNNIAKDSLSVKRSNKHDLLLYDAKVVLTRLSKRQIAKAKAVKSDCNKKKLKKGINDHTISKKKRSESTVNKSDSKFDSWNRKCETIINADASKNGKNTMCSMSGIRYDNNSNIMNVSNKFEVLQSHILKKKWEDNKYNSYKSSMNLKLSSKNKVLEWKKSILSSDDYLKQKYNMCKNFNACENERKNVCLDSKSISEDSILLSQKIFPTNGSLTNDTADKTISNEIVKEDTLYKTGKEQDLLSKGQTKDCKSSLCMVACENVKKIKKLPVITKATLLSKNTVRISIKKKQLNEDCRDSRNLNLLQIFTENNFNGDISKNEISHISSNNLLEKSNNTEFELKDPAKSTDYVELKKNNSRSYSTLENNDIGVQDNHGNIHCEHYLVDTSSNSFESSSNVNTLTTNETTSEFNNNNNFLKHEQEYILEDMQEITGEEETTSKRNNIVHNQIEDSHKNINLLKEKCTNSNESIDNDCVKRVKLNRKSWIKYSRTKYESTSTIDACINASNVVKTNTGGTIPQLASKKDSMPNIVVQNIHNENLSKEITESKSKNKQGISNSVNPKQIETLRNVNKQERDLLQNTWESIETFKSPVEDKGLFSDAVNPNNESTMDDNNDDDNDCISLFADPALIEEYDNLATPATGKSYAMTDNVIDTYYEKIMDECNKALDINSANDSNNNTLQKNRRPLELMQNTMPNIIKNVPSSSSMKLFQNSQMHKTIQVTNRQNPDTFTDIFQGYCYRFIKFGKCFKSHCHFKHDFLQFMLDLYKRDEHRLFEVIDELASRNFVKFLNKFYELLVTYGNDVICTLNVSKKLYELKFLTNDMGLNCITQLVQNGASITTILNDLTTIVNRRDSKFVNWFIKRAETCMAHYICNGGYWDVIRPLLLKIENLDLLIVEMILRECVIRKTNVQDVHKNIVCKLDDGIRSKVDQTLLLTFNNLLKHAEENQMAKKNSLMKPVISVQSPDSYNVIHEPKNALTANESSAIKFSKVCQDIPCKTKKWDGNNDAQNETSSLTLHPIDDLPKPYSRHSRERFWKFYVVVHSLQEGLKHSDYNHVKEILNTVEEGEKSLFTSACYQILCNEIMHSQYHLSNLTSHAVRSGTTAVFYEIVLNVAIHILAELAEKELWVLAFQLLKDIDIILQTHIRLYEFDAITIMLFAEIYLANQRPVKAFTLLKQSNIICTNRNKWKVRSNPKDDYVRSQLVALLLDTFCKTSLEYALFLFNFLIVDQTNNFKPVDLTRAANKIVSTLLLAKDYELIVDIVRQIDNYNCVLNTVTYRAIISVLVHIDVNLAKRLYQNAVALGIYFKIQFHPATYVIINSDWTNEEMYLAILALMEQLSLNIGHAIDRIRPNQLSVYLVFENIPSEKQLACEKEMHQQCDNKIKDSKTLMRSVLAKQFDPPILVAKVNRGKLQKLNSTSIHRHLQCKRYV